MQTYEWTRPSLPDRHGSACFTWGILGLVAAAALAIGGFLLLELYLPIGWFALYASGALVLPSLTALLFGCLIEEVRRSAFESAIRAGEVIIVDQGEANSGVAGRDKTA